MTDQKLQCKKCHSEIDSQEDEFNNGLCDVCYLQWSNLHISLEEFLTQDQNKPKQMLIITDHDIAIDTIRRYRSSYKDWESEYAKDLKRRIEISETLVKLKALDRKTVTCDQVNAIIKNMWAELKCSSCKKHVKAVVEYNSNHARICFPCLTLIYGFMKDNIKNPKIIPYI